MKIVALIGNTSAPLTYFVNTINKHHKIDLIVLERKNKKNNNIKNTRKKDNSSFLVRVLNYILFKLELKRSQKIKKQLEKSNYEYYLELFKNDFTKIDSKIPIVIVEDINSKEVENLIKDIEPKLIIDHGTSVVKSNIINLADIALNLHWGLSPYYRGVNCTIQALLNWDTNNIGVTVHKLAKNIDGGDILSQERTRIDANDNISRITSRLTYMGTRIIIKAIDKLILGETLCFKSQDFKNGFLIKGMYWDNKIDNYLNQSNSDLYTKMIDKPSRDEVPIISFK